MYRGNFVSVINRTLMQDNPIEETDLTKEETIHQEALKYTDELIKEFIREQNKTN